MDKAISERVAAFEEHMSVSWEQLAREEIAAGKRWNLLQAVAYLATGDHKLVEQVFGWCPHNNALPHPNAAQAAYIHLSKELDQRRSSGDQCLSINAGTRALLAALNDGSVTAYVDAMPTHLTGMKFRELTCRDDMIGLAPHPPEDDRQWGSVYVNVEELAKFRGAAALSSEDRTAIDNGGQAPKILTTDALRQVVDRCVANRLGADPTRKAIEAAFPGREVPRKRIRELHRERWIAAFGEAPSLGANSRS